MGDVVHGEHLAGRNRQALARNEVACRHALKRGIDRGEQNGGPAAIPCARQPRQRRHALRKEAGMRGNPVIGQTVPRRKLLYGEIRRKKVKRTGERGHTRAVPANGYEARCRSVPPRSHGTGHVGNDEPFSAVGDARQCERPAGVEKRDGIGCGAHRAPPPLRLNSRSRRNNAVS